MLPKKYGRTYHYPFSPGATSDDRINKNYWQDIQSIKTLIHTEKLDGENTCINQFGVFARSHAAPTTSPWSRSIAQRSDIIKQDLGDIELFGENLYAIHSIEYTNIESHFYLFAVRCIDMWLSWEEVEFYADMFDFPTVPVLSIQEVQKIDKTQLENQIVSWTQDSSIFGSIDSNSKQICTREGVVSRNIKEYPVDEFANQVFKYVRKGHVQANEHWTRNWKRAHLAWEIKNKRRLF